MVKRSIVVTGVSTGIGFAAAQSLTRAGHRVFGSVRKAADGERVAAALGPLFIPLEFDVTDGAAIAAAAERVAADLNGEPLAGLVNNAGIAVPGPLAMLPMAELRHQFEVNVFGLMQTTQAFLPLMEARAGVPYGPGKIVNISSVAGKVAMPFNGAYAASKFAVEALSDSLRRELQVHGIDVVLIEPGPVKTAIWDKIDEVGLARYRASAYGRSVDKMLDYIRTITAKAVPAERLGDLVLSVMTNPTPKARYVVVPSLVEHLILYWLPARWVDRLIGRQLALVPTRG